MWPRWGSCASSPLAVPGLLAEVAGILEGTSEGELSEPRARQAAWLCRDAGARPRGNPGMDGERAAAAVRGGAPAV